MSAVYLYITPFFPSSERWQGGYCYDAVRAIARSGRYDVRVMVTGEGPDYEYGGVKVFRFVARQFPCGVLPFVLARRNQKRFLGKLESMGISMENVAVCHLNTMGYSIYGEVIKRVSPNTKVLLQFHNNAPLTLGSGRLGRLPVHATCLYLFYRRMYAAADAYVYISKRAQGTFGLTYTKDPEEHWHDIRSDLLFGRFLPDLVLKKSILLYNGVDGNVFQQSPANEDKVRSPFVIGCVANFQRLKDQMTLLRAFKRVIREIPNSRLRFVGSGVCLDDCRQWATENLPNDVVSFECEMDHLKLPAFYRSLDLFVLPTRLDGFGCVCAEAHACGVPFMTTTVAGVSEVIEEGERKDWLFEPMNDERLAELILRYRKSPKVQRLGVEVNIDRLMSRFLDEVGNLKSVRKRQIAIDKC